MTDERGSRTGPGVPLPDKRYFGIREVAELCGVRPHVLRHWEREFPRLNPPRGGSNRRYYRPQDVHLIRRIRFLLWDCRYTIEGARRRLEEPEDAPAEVLRAIRGELAAIRDQLDRTVEPGSREGQAGTATGAHTR